jgi:hypothetical protein
MTGYDTRAAFNLLRNATPKTRMPSSHGRSGKDVNMDKALKRRKARGRRARKTSNSDQWTMTLVILGFCVPFTIGFIMVSARHGLDYVVPGKLGMVAYKGLIVAAIMDVLATVVLMVMWKPSTRKFKRGGS